MSRAVNVSPGTFYVGAVSIAGAIVVAHSLLAAFLAPPPAEWLVLAGLTLFTGSFTVKVPAQHARLSVSETFVFTSTLLFGPAAGTVTAVLEALVMSFWLKRSSLSRVFFNISAPAIAIWTAAQTFFLISGLKPGEIQRPNLGEAVGPLFVFALLYFVINTGLVAGAVRTQRDEPVRQIWLQNFAALSINYFVGGSIAILLVAYTPRIDVTSLGIIVPILLISYFTFRTSMGRLEDATKHVEQLNELYLSTIETLAMAVDAKDQITHGHIRRVQVYALELAKRLGVADERQLKAIEAAALLHDLGKLAIPEHILNKPGKLTSGEFEKMKRHADIGADLLSSIPFPYPVAPIVRHHHENWDGSGYPHRVAGTDIPLGARILSVVDCFDALTSDRPYRPRLSDDAAFEILRERRGTMYDPLIVDAFVESYAAIAPAAILAGQQARTLLSGDLLQPNEANTALNEIHNGAAAGVALIELRRAIKRSRSEADIIEAVAQTARHATPATVVALYVYVPERDLLRCVCATGDPDQLLPGLEIHSGQRTTGWAAANLAVSLNSSASLDLPYICDRFSPPLKSTVSVPLVSRGVLKGVLTLYSNGEHAFDHRHQYLGEQIANILVEQLNPPSINPEVVRFPAFGRPYSARS
jgi:putative nucleotidyltransferase with HDIG domain